MDALVMTWFDIMKLKSIRTGSVPGSYKSSHKVDWLDINVWSDFGGVIVSFIDDKQDIAVDIKNGNPIRTKSAMTEHPIDSMGRYFGGPNNYRGYGQLKREVSNEHKKGEALRQRLTNIQLNHQRMEDYMNTMVNKYLTTKGTPDEFTEYRRNATLFGMMASGVGPKQTNEQQTHQFIREVFGEDAKIRAGARRKRKYMIQSRYMRSSAARCGVMPDMNYALKLLKTRPKKSKKNDDDFDNLMEHIKRKDQEECKKRTQQLIDRVFNFNKMQHCPIKGGLLKTPKDHAWIKNYVNKSHNLAPIKDLAKTSTNPKDYYEMFKNTHPKTMSRDTPLYQEMWRYGSHGQVYAFNLKVIKPFRVRLLLIWNFHLACTGEATVEEFEEWVN